MPEHPEQYPAEPTEQAPEAQAAANMTAEQRRAAYNQAPETVPLEQLPKRTIHPRGKIALMTAIDIINDQIREIRQRQKMLCMFADRSLEVIALSEQVVRLVAVREFYIKAAKADAQAEAGVSA